MRSHPARKDTLCRITTLSLSCLCGRLLGTSLRSSSADGRSWIDRGGVSSSLSSHRIASIIPLHNFASFGFFGQIPRLLVFSRHTGYADDRHRASGSLFWTRLAVARLEVPRGCPGWRGVCNIIHAFLQLYRRVYGTRHNSTLTTQTLLWRTTTSLNFTHLLTRLSYEMQAGRRDGEEER